MAPVQGQEDDQEKWHAPSVMAPRALGSGIKDKGLCVRPEDQEPRRTRKLYTVSGTEKATEDVLEHRN